MKTAAEALETSEFSRVFASITPEQIAARQSEMAAITQQRRQAAHEARESALLRGSGCPERQLACTEKRGDEWQQKLATLQELRMRGKGMTVALVGSRGTGKTQIGVELIRDTVRDLKPALYTTAVGFFLALKATFGRDSGRTEQEVLERYVKPRLLVIDECEKRAESEWANQLFFELVNQRYAAMKDTILISNQTKAEFEKYIGDSIVSRMSETGGTIECNWESFRK